jgi:hypothetical protein
MSTSLRRLRAARGVAAVTSPFFSGGFFDNAEARS